MSMQKTLILAVFGSVMIVCIAAQIVSVQYPPHAARIVAKYDTAPT
jgi:hypothetical protein